MPKRVISIFLSLSLLLSSVSMNAFAAEMDNETQVPVGEEVIGLSGTSSADAPEEYTPISSADISAQTAVTSDSNMPRVLLIQDTLPWSSNANTTVLNQLGIPYDIVGTTDFVESVDLEQYAVVIFANDQEFSAYENYEEFKEYLELFAEVGGVIVFGACDIGWANGVMTADLPGDVQKKNLETYLNYINDPLHPIVTGELSDNGAISDEDLEGTYCSHTYFIEDTLPAGSRVILRNSANDAPTLVEYPLKNGRIIASGVTWEYSYDLVGNSYDGYVCRDFSVKAMEDLFLYAIRVSNIQVGELHRLEEYRLSANAHYIIVSDRDGNAIQDAIVTVDDKGYTTDSNGSVAVNDFGKKTVKISASNYQTLQLTYTLEASSARIFFLNEEDALKLPYIIRLQDVNNEYDYMSQKVYYPEGKDESVTIKMEAEWQGKTPAEYVLFQTDETGNRISYLVSSTGDFIVSPGMTFKPGYDVKARLYASDGTASKEIRTGIVIQENTVDTEVGDMENLTSFRLFEDTNSTLNDSNATKIFPSTWSVEVDALPIEMKKDYDPEDGSSTYKGTIGIAGGKWTNDLLDDESGEGEWWTFVSEIEKAKELYSSREKLLEKLDDELANANLTSQVKAKLEAVGYFEVKLNAFGDVVKTSGGLIIKGSGSYNLGGTFALGPVPVYYEIGFGAKFDGSIGLKLTCVDDLWNLGMEGSLSITIPDITLGGGVGVYGVAQLGVEGNGGLEIGIFPSWTGTLQASASIKVKVLFLGEYKWQLGNGWKEPLWPSENARAYSLDEMYALALETDDVTISPVSDAYADNTTAWNGTGEVLQDWILPDTMPELIDAGNQIMALFQANLDGKIKLVYSLYDGNAWSAPVAVSNDTTHDVYFKPVATANGDVYVAWQTSTVTDDDIENVLSNAASNSEIYVTKWDGTTFDSAVRLTTNTDLDMLPRMAASNGNVAIAAWVNDPYNSIMAGSTQTTIQYAASSDGWTQKETLATIPGSVSDFAVGSMGGDVVACYIMDGTLYSSESAQPIAGGESVDNGIAYYDGAFYWCNDGILYTYTESGVTPVIEDIAVSSNYRMVSGNKDAIVWAVNETERGILYASIDLGDHWSQPIEIFSGDGYSVSYFDAQMGTDGTWYTMIDAVSDAGNGEKTSLLFHSAESLNDVKLDYAYALESDRIGDIQPIDISVTNLGDTTVTTLDVSITGGNIAENKTLACSIEPGATENYTIDLDVSSVTSETFLNVTISAARETDDTNNSYDVAIGLVDASVDLDYYFNDDSIIVAARVSNNGDVQMHASISVIEDNDSGIVIDMKNLGVVSSAEDVLYLYAFNTSEIDFMNRSSKNYVFRVDTLEGDYNAINNTETAIIYNENKPSYAVIVNASPASGGSVTGDGNYDEDASVTVKATANSGYRFVRWTEGNTTVSTSAVYTFEITENRTLTAVFERTGNGGGGGSYGGGGGGGAATYSLTVGSTANGTVTSNRNSATSGSTVTLTVTPDQGYALSTLSVTDGSGRAVALNDIGGGKYTFKMPSSRVTIAATFAPASNPFTDVAAGQYYYDAVIWAVGRGITTGVTPTTFDPSGVCTRAQIVTFLWRTYSQPAPVAASSAFTDVDLTGWYGKAVLWAVENGITTGTTPSIFGPSEACTRAQVVTFLWRAAGEPEPTTTANPFTDVDLDAYYGKAVLWAVEKGITTGTTATTFSPNEECTRAQIVTFLYRFANQQS